MKKRTFYIATTLLTAMFPLAVLVALLPHNKYSIIGIDQAIDCDSPFIIMMLAIPSYLVYGGGAICFGVLAKDKKKRSYGVITLLCFLITAFITPNALRAYQEHFDPSHQERCEKGW